MNPPADHPGRPGHGAGAEGGLIHPFPIGEQTTTAETVGRMADTAFQARNLGQAARIWDAALRDEATIFFGLAGAMVPAGMRPVIVYLIENRLIDVIVSTGANLYHDVYESLGFSHAAGDPEGDDVRLAHLRLLRFYDVLAPEHEFSRGERFCTEFALTLDGDRPYPTREYFQLFGQALAAVAKEEGILTAAAKHGVPVYCPAVGDSVHGLAVAEARLRGKRIVFDIIGDVLELVHLSVTAKKSAVIYIGGGTPKNFIQQSGAACYLYDRDPPGHSYGIQITMDQPQWGGLSGCTFEEAQSWRKIAPDARFVTVNVEATVALPLIVSALAEGSQSAIKGRRLPELDWEWEKAARGQGAFSEKP
ncbi:MAG: deoxyhypusine synthase family protein [Dehalococcoidia bacterium]|nr:deoxyhypusine synthase family protein [Dehalococcoidia bacterium]